MDEQENEINDESNFADSFDSPETKSIGLGWRVVAAIIALVVLGVLAYPFLRERLNVNPDPPPPTSKTQTVLTAPEATAQANPDSAEAQFKLGNAYVESGQLEQALAAYQKTIELDPDYQVAYVNLGVVYYQLQQFDLAELQYQKALELDPNDGEVAYNLGALYLQHALLNDQPDPDLLNQAVIQLKQAMEMSPDLAEPYFSLGVAHAALNQREEAVQSFETFLARDSGQDPRASQEAERYLQALRGQ